MKITILCVGKIKEKFYRDAIAEYSKRLSRYCKLDIIEVADEKTPENASDTVENQIREKEAERILMRLHVAAGVLFVPVYHLVDLCKAAVKGNSCT